MRQTPVWLRILICVGICGVCAVFSATIPSLLVIVAAFTACMAVAWGLVYAAPVLAVNVLTMLFAWAMTPSLYCAIAEYALLMVALTLCFYKKVPYRYTLLIAAAILTVCSYLSLTIDSLVVGDAPTAMVVSEYNAMAKTVLDSIEGVDGADTVATYLRAFGSILPDILMMLVVCAAEGIALLSVLLTRVFCKWLGAQTRPMAPFYRWRLPKSIGAGTIFMIVICGALFIFKLSAAAAFTYSIAAVLVTMYSMQGLALLFYIYHRMRVTTFGFVMTWIIVAVLFPYSILMLLPMGVIEQIKKRRLMYDAAARQMELEAKLRDKRDEYDKYGYTSDDVAKAKHEASGGENSVKAQKNDSDEHNAEEKRNAADNHANDADLSNDKKDDDRRGGQ